jgi:hypothetical protein
VLLRTGLLRLKHDGRAAFPNGTLR